MDWSCAGGATRHRGGAGSLLALFVQIVCVGFFLGSERTLVPLLGHQAYHVAAGAVALGITAFGVAKGPANALAGWWVDRAGPRRVVWSGWAMGGLAVAAFLVPGWSGAVLAYGLLGGNQGLTWTTLVTAQIVQAGPRRGGTAIGLNEALGVLSTAGGTALAGLMAGRFGLRGTIVGMGAAAVLAGGLLAWTLPPIIRAESTKPKSPVLPLVWMKDRHWGWATLGAVLDKAADAAVWVGAPLLLTAHGVAVATVGVLTASYTAVYGLGQGVAGWVADQWGRKGPLVGGFLALALGLATFARASGPGGWAAGLVLGGLGLAAVSPALSAVVSDVAPPSRRGTWLGAYRFWRDGSYALWGVVFGGLFTTLGGALAFGVIGGLCALFAGALIPGLPATTVRGARGRSR